MSLSVFSYCICVSFSLAEAVSGHLCTCVVCRHICCPVSLFQGHVACRNFTQTGPLTCSLLRSFFFRLVTQRSSFLSLWGGALRDEPKNGSARETINRGVTFEDRYRRQGRNFTTNDSKILDLKSSSEQIFSEN